VAKLSEKRKGGDCANDADNIANKHNNVPHTSKNTIISYALCYRIF
jgi:hypothetical protein